MAQQVNMDLQVSTFEISNLERRRFPRIIMSKMLCYQASAEWGPTGQSNIRSSSGQERTCLLVLLYLESLIDMAPKKRYYALEKAKEVGIFFDYWDNMKHLTQGTSKPIYRGFGKLEEAERFMKQQGLDTVDIITEANAESEIQHSSSSEEIVEMNVCDEEYEDRRKDRLVDSNIENSISNMARSIEDVEKSMNKEFNKIWMALSSITLNLSNLNTKCECRELSNQLLKNKEAVLKLEAMIETKENEIASLKEIIAILKETQNA